MAEAGWLNVVIGVGVLALAHALMLSPLLYWGGTVNLTLGLMAVLFWPPHARDDH